MKAYPLQVVLCAGLTILLGVAAVAVGSRLRGVTDRVASFHVEGPPRWDPVNFRHAGATSSEFEVVNRLPPEIAVLVDEHEAVRAALAWRIPSTMCH